MELLEDKTSVEDFVEWGQSVLHTTVKVCPLYVCIYTTGNLSAILAKQIDA